MENVTLTLTADEAALVAHLAWKAYESETALRDTDRTDMRPVHNRRRDLADSLYRKAVTADHIQSAGAFE